MKQIKTFSRRNFKIPFFENFWWEEFRNALDYEILFEFSNNKLITVSSGNGTKKWHQNGKLHRTNGPAIECADGTKFWYLEGKKLSEEDFLTRMKNSCAGKIVEIEGKKYQLREL